VSGDLIVARQVSHPARRVRRIAITVEGLHQMQNDELLVGMLALLLSAVASAIAMGPWRFPYELTTVSAVQRRFGKLAARLMWAAIAITCLLSGIAILSGFRPPYAVPDRQIESIR
jgi:hypothetical protein